MGLRPPRSGSSGRATLHAELGWGAGEMRTSASSSGTAARCHGAVVERPEPVSGRGVSSTPGPVL